MKLAQNQSVSLILRDHHQLRSKKNLRVVSNRLELGKTLPDLCSRLWAPFNSQRKDMRTKEMPGREEEIGKLRVEMVVTSGRGMVVMLKGDLCPQVLGGESSNISNILQICKYSKEEFLLIRYHQECSRSIIFTFNFVITYCMHFIR